MPQDLLLPVPAHPQPPSAAALGAALDAAAALGAHVTAVVCAPTLSLPVVLRHPYPQSVLDEHAARQEALARSAGELRARLEEEAQRRGLEIEGAIMDLVDSSGTSPLLEPARLKNLTLLPALPGDEFWGELTQTLIFEAGRPVLVLPAAPARPFRLDCAVIAWDFSRAASRALQDALPLLRKAKRVRAVTVKNEKRLAGDPAGSEFARHLARNGIETALEEIDLAGRSIGRALDEATADADLLVMGAFGHSRLRDFFLGGATRHVLENPKLPVFLSH